MRAIHRRTVSAIVGAVEDSGPRFRGRAAPTAARRPLAGPSAVRFGVAVACALLVTACSAGRGRPAAVAAPVAAPPPPAAPAPPPAPAPLEVGRPQDGDLAGGERRVYPLQLAAGDYARVYVEQHLGGDPGIDLVATLLGPDGAQVASVDGPGGVAVGEQLSLVAVGTGTYELILTPSRPTAPRGRFRVDLEERRPGLPGDDTRVVVEGLINEASQLRTLETEAADTRARDLLERALPRAKDSGDSGHEGDAETLLGDIQLARGHFAEARDRYESAAASYDRAGDRPGRAIALSNLGLANQSLGNLDAALRGYQDSLAVSRELGNRSDEATTLHNMGLAGMALGDLDRAAGWLREALELWHRVGSPQREAKTLNALANLELRRGEVDRALEDAIQALALARTSGGKSAEAYCLNLVAGIQRVRGDLQLALRTFGEALRLNHERGAASDEAKVLNNLGVVKMDLGDDAGATQSFTDALDIFTRLGIADGQAEALRNLGSLAVKRHDPAAALSSYRRALSISQRLENPLAEAVASRLLGGALLAAGRVDEAIDHLRRSLELHLAAHDRLGEALARLSIATAYARAGDFARAREQFARARSLSEALEFPLATSRAHLGLAKLDREAGDLTASLHEIEQAVDIYERLRSGLEGDRLRTSFFTGSREYYELYIDVLMALARSDPQAGNARLAFAVSERARARSLLDLLNGARVRLTRGVSPDVGAEELRLERVIPATENLLSEALSGAAPSSERVALLKTELARFQAQGRALDERIRLEAPRYAELKSPRPLDLTTVQGRLDERAALLEYAIGAENSYLFVVTHDAITTYSLPPARELRAEVENLRAAMTSGERKARGAFALAARQLYRELVEPAEGALTGKEDLLIAPDAALYYLPFEALLTADPGTTAWSRLPYLLAARTISYIPSASVLASLANGDETESVRGPDAKLFVAFADPDYGSAGSEPRADGGDTRDAVNLNRLHELPRLAGSAREVEQIADLFGRSRSMLYLGDRASEENVRDSPFLAHAAWVHFATHGLLDEENPERSGLALTPVSDSADPTDDGVLRVGEIFNLELHADLVVLSACDTGLGVEVSGEGMLGLTRAFLYAGSPSVIVSLWAVEDRSTAGLMVAFKRHLDEGADRAAALRLAKLDLIAADDTADPRLWAPFILVGKRGAGGALSMATR
jgi:CHAT domain-containing protein/Tfp pilus assembly protein PilF